MHRLVATILLLIFVVGVLAVAIYSIFLVDSRPYPPTIFSYSDDYWKGLYSFGFAVSNGSIRDVVNQYLVVMDQNGAYLGFVNSSTHSFNYINQLSDSDLYRFPGSQGGHHRASDVLFVVAGGFRRGHRQDVQERIHRIGDADVG